MIVLDFMEKGGFFMWPLFIVALLAVYIIIYKALQLYGLYFHYKRNQDIFDIRNELKQGDYEAALKKISGQSPVEKILNKGIDYLISDFDENAVAGRLEMIYEEEVHKLDKGLSILLILGEIMPMLGLLGTVSGMIQVFKAISVYGAADAQVLASGISEALLTTETGLVLAIPAMFIYTVFNSQVEKQTKLMRQAGAVIVNSLQIAKKNNN